MKHSEKWQWRELFTNQSCTNSVSVFFCAVYYIRGKILCSFCLFPSIYSQTSIQELVIYHYVLQTPHVSGDKQTVINRSWNAVIFFFFFFFPQCRQYTLVLCSCSIPQQQFVLFLSISLFPFSPCLVSYLSCSPSSLLSSKPTQIFPVHYFSLVSPPSLYQFFFSLKNSNDVRAFTVFTSFKTNMWHSAVPVETFDGSVLHSGLSELPALEHSGMLHYTIGQGTRKMMYEIQKKIKKKGTGMEVQGASS